MAIQAVERAVSIYLDKLPTIWVVETRRRYRGRWLKWEPCWPLNSFRRRARDARKQFFMDNTDGRQFRVVAYVRRMK